MQTTLAAPRPPPSPSVSWVDRKVASSDYLTRALLIRVQEVAKSAPLPVSSLPLPDDGADDTDASTSPSNTVRSMSPRSSSQTSLKSSEKEEAELPRFQHVFKVVLLGHPGVGKRTLARALATEDKGSKSPWPMAAVVTERRVETEKKKLIQVQLWAETCGRFPSVPDTLLFRGACVCLVLYDATSVDSMRSVTSWFELIENRASDKLVRILVANKTDLVPFRGVDERAGRALAERWNASFIAVSAKDFHNLTQLIDLTISSKTSVKIVNFLRKSSAAFL